MLTPFHRHRYEAQLEKDWLYILNDSDAKVLVVATEAIYEKVKNYPGTVNTHKLFSSLRSTQSQIPTQPENLCFCHVDLTSIFFL